jgi:hypothetical protein
VDRHGLREFLDNAGVLRAAYDLDGRGVEDGLTLDLSDGRYKVLYTERGNSSLRREFASEDEACRFLADELLRYEPYRFEVVDSSPHRGVSAQEFLEHWLGANGLTLSDMTDDDFRIGFTPGRSGGTEIRLSVRRTFLRARGLDC